MSMPFEAKIGPAPELIDEHHPALYRETNFAEFMNLLTSKEYKARAFLDSITLHGPSRFLVFQNHHSFSSRLLVF
jgi:hypothetical protein